MNPLQAVARRLASIGVTANIMTILGFAVNAAAGVLAGQGSFRVAAWVALFGGLCDLLDGKIARLNPERTKFGALLDSSLDRYGDAFLIAGIGYYFSGFSGGAIALLAAFSALIGSFEVSYVRARAEGLGFECRIGFWERGERWVLLIFGLVCGHPGTAVLILAWVTHVTALRRLRHVRLIAKSGGQVDRHGDAGKWSRPLSWVLAAGSLGLVSLFRWPF